MRRRVVGHRRAIGLGRAAEVHDTVATTALRLELAGAVGVTGVQAVQRAGHRAERIARPARSAGRAEDRAAMAGEADLRGRPIGQFRTGVGSVDAMAQRVETVGERGDAGGVPAIPGALPGYGPDIEDRVVASRQRIFQQCGLAAFRDTDLRRAARIAGFGVQVVVRHVMHHRPARTARGRGDQRWRQAFQPVEGGVLDGAILARPAPAVGAGHQRLEQAEGGGRPVADTVIAPGQQVDLDQQGAALPEIDRRHGGRPRHCLAFRSALARSFPKTARRSEPTPKRRAAARA